MKRFFSIILVCMLLVVSLVTMTGCGEESGGSRNKDNENKNTASVETKQNNEENKIEEVKYEKMELNEANKITVSGYEAVGTTFNDGLVEVKKDGKYGFMNKKGELIVECKYDFASEFHDGMAWVGVGPNSHDAMYTYVNTEGKQMSDFIYKYNDSGSYFSRTDHIAWVNEKGYGWKAINKNMEMVIDGKDYYAAHPFVNGCCKVELMNVKDPIYLDVNGNEVDESHWDLTDKNPNHNKLWEKYDKNSQLHGYIYSDNQDVLALDYQFKTAGVFCEGLAYVKTADDREMYIDDNANVVLEFVK